MDPVGCEQLAALAGEGDDAAFELLVERHRAGLVRFAGSRLSGSGLDPEDVVQDGLVGAHSALRRGFRPRDVRAWLHVIVRNGCASALRRPRASGGVDSLIEARPSESAADAAERREELGAVVADIKALCPPQRAAIVGRELEGRSHAELAATGATTISAVKSLLVRGRFTLKARAGDRALGVGGLGALWTRLAPAGPVVVTGLPLGKAGALLSCGAVGLVCLGSAPKVEVPSPAGPAIPPPELVRQAAAASVPPRPAPRPPARAAQAPSPPVVAIADCDEREIDEYGGCAR